MTCRYRASVNTEHRSDERSIHMYDKPGAVHRKSPLMPDFTCMAPVPRTLQPKLRRL